MIPHVNVRSTIRAVISIDTTVRRFAAHMAHLARSQRPRWKHVLRARAHHSTEPLLKFSRFDWLRQRNVNSGYPCTAYPWCSLYKPDTKRRSKTHARFPTLCEKFFRRTARFFSYLRKILAAFTRRRYTWRHSARPNSAIKLH